MKKGILRIATCQFAVSGNIKTNSRQIQKQIAQAKRKKTDIAFFSESALSGYPGADMPDFSGFDWDLLKAETLTICEKAQAANIWIVLGSSHPLSGKHKPHNSLYIINPQGKIVNRYDKRFCTSGDLKHFSPGDHYPVVTINGVKCGFLICYDVRFPEQYREYKQKGVQLMFHAFHNARKKGRMIHSEIMRPTLQARAASNYMWVCANNSSAHYQLWPSLTIQPDGHIVSSCKLHTAGMIVETIDTNRELYDAAGANRMRSIKGQYCSGKPVDDPRSRNRKGL